MLALALIAFLAAQTDERAIGLNPAEWVAPDDYPEEALIGEEEGTTGFRLDIDRQGKATGCTITSSSGSPALDAATCALTLERAKFRPARKGGVPVADTYNQRIAWRLPDPEPPQTGRLLTRIDLNSEGRVDRCVTEVSGDVPEDTRAAACDFSGVPPEIAKEIGSKIHRIFVISSISDKQNDYPIDMNNADLGVLVAHREAEIIFSLENEFLTCNRRQQLGDGPDLCGDYVKGRWAKERAAAPPGNIYTIRFAIFNNARVGKNR